MRFAALLLIALVTFEVEAGGRRAVIVVIDGARYSETFGGGPTYIPRIWNELRPAGRIWTNFRNEGVTSTVPGHSSILTGTWQVLPNDGSQRPSRPTIFEYFRKWTGASDSLAWVVSGKKKLGVLSYGEDSTYGSRWGARVAITKGDTAACAAARQILLRVKPQLMLINLPETDLKAHAEDWQGYLAAIRTADSLVVDLWRFLRADTLFADSTLFLVTNDHGRHLDGVRDGFTNHGDACEGCRHIMLAGWGGDFRRGDSTGVRATQIDIAPTVGEWLGFPVPQGQGRSLLK
jgi:hypothetical protein